MERNNVARSLSVCLAEANAKKATWKAETN